MCRQLVYRLVQYPVGFLPGNLFQEIIILRLVLVQVGGVLLLDLPVLAMIEVDTAGNRVHESLGVFIRREFLPVLEHPRERLLREISG